MIEPKKQYDPGILFLGGCLGLLALNAAFTAFAAWEQYLETAWLMSIGFALTAAFSFWGALRIARILRIRLRYGTIIPILLVAVTAGGVIPAAGAADREMTDAAIRCIAQNFLETALMPNLADITSVERRGDVVVVNFRRTSPALPAGFIAAPDAVMQARIRLAPVPAPAGCECTGAEDMKIIVKSYEIGETAL